MATLGSVIAELRNASTRIDRVLCISITRDSAEIVSRLRTESPVSTGTLRYSWRLGRAFSSTGVPASIRITNSAPHAPAIEYGIDPSSTTHSWALSLRKEGKKRGVRIALSKGRIWSSSAIGGVSSRVLSPSVVNKMAKNVADSIISSLSKK